MKNYEMITVREFMKKLSNEDNYVATSVEEYLTKVLDEKIA